MANSRSDAAISSGHTPREEMAASLLLLAMKMKLHARHDKFKNLFLGNFFGRKTQDNITEHTSCEGAENYP